MGGREEEGLGAFGLAIQVPAAGSSSTSGTTVVGIGSRFLFRDRSGE